MNYNWAGYQSATGCTKYGPAGAQALLTYLEDRFPDQVSMGICNCRPVFNGTSWSHHAECRAYDEGFAVFIGQTIGIETLKLLGPHGIELGLDHIIMNHFPGSSGRGDPRIYSARSPQGRTYTGAHPHKNHDHIGLTRNSGLHLTYATLVSVLGPPTPKGDDDMIIEALKAQTMAYYEMLQNKTGSPVGNASYWGSDYAGTPKPSNQEWLDAADELFAASLEAGVMTVPSGGDHPDSDHTELATKRSVSTVANGLAGHIGRKTFGPHS